MNAPRSISGVRQAAIDVFNAARIHAKKVGVDNYRQGAWNAYLTELARIRKAAQ